MSITEFKRLNAYEYAKSHAFRPTRNVTSRRSAKNPSSGQKFIIGGRIISEVSLEKVFNPPNWIKNSR